MMHITKISGAIEELGGEQEAELETQAPWTARSTDD